MEGLDAEYDSLQESVAVYVWKKKQRIDLLRTISLVVAAVNPEKAKEALSNLIEEQFPEQKFEREQAVDKALRIMEEERKKVFSVSARQPQKQRGLVERVNKVLKRGS